MKKLVFWQNCISIHQAPLLRELSATPGVDVTVIADEDIPLERQSMGWETADYGSCEVIIGPSPSQRALILKRLRNADAHLFSGLASYPGPTSSFKDLLRGKRNHVSIISESWDPRGARASLRTLLYKHKVAKYGNAVDSILTIGELARKQFERAGIASGKLQPFGYFVDKSEALRMPTEGRPFRVLFVGSMSALKKPLMLLESLASFPDHDWELRYVGEGSELGKVRRSAEFAGVGQRVSFLPFGSNRQVRQEMADADLLVLPSSYDGWGVVVNEALQSGTRVAVSSAAGASELVRGELQGWTFSPAHPTELADVISSARQQLGSDRRRLIEWSETAISPQAAAQYLLAVVELDGRGEDDAKAAPWLI
ncbi:glycosyltransferase family 4 protein [Pseudarthrobacter cellobiosi]|uniref:glycosyltransferase family 4 protein n=1 Tax=Pseudarthrobacter cellobiosi TaxID=2953654 RepID=UPI00208EAB64|nr:glycosyltransferase [Pseudarthrobacter sp. HLT1-5]MCO4254752.1 glycosyltransferase [Pseudarthrobacter sp. HLT1-5]